MNLIQSGVLSLTLLALADGFMLSPIRGFGGMSAIFGILILILFIAALGKRTNTNLIVDCPANYTPIPNDPTSCIRFVSSPTKTMEDAFLECENDGGYLLKLSTSTFPIIQNLASNISGTCNYWVEAREDTDGDWFDLNNVTIPTTPGIFFFDPANTRDADCGLMATEYSFFLTGATCTDLQCYICQRDI